MNFDFVTDIFTQLAQMAVGAESWQQIAVLMLAGAIPFIESYLGSFLGVILGINPFLVVASAVAGNVITTFLLIAIASKARSLATRNRETAPRKERTPRQQKVANYAHRVGVPGVCLLGPLVLASQITAPTLIALGARRAAVYIWQGIAIIVWGILFGFFGEAVVRFLF